MKIIQREHLDTAWWDALVENDSDTDLFSLSAYLDVTAENWCVLVNESYTGGIALPYTIRFGIKTCYTPIFVRGVKWIGVNRPDLKEIENSLQSEFIRCHLAIHGFSFGVSDNENVFQLIAINSNRQMGDRGKRMLKKFDAAQFKIHVVTSSYDILHHISLELPKKIKEINAQSLTTLRELIRQFETKNDLIGLQVFDKQNISVGGILLLKNEQKLMYLKGAFVEDAKKQGAMYGAMNHAIQLAQSKGLHFDFGGSRVAGVRNFNLILGGEDVHYDMLIWDGSPWWFKLFKRTKDLWKRK